MTTRKRSSSSRGGRAPKGTPRAPRTTEPIEEVAAEPVIDLFPAEPEPVAETLPVTVTPEPAFASRVTPPEPAPPPPRNRRAIFFDVENTSRPEHVDSVLRHLALDRIAVRLDLIAVGNWRVIGHETARILAERGAQCVHSAPSVGVRDWSDLRIAVAAGVWLAGARPGDQIDIISDDQAFDAVGDVAASLGVAFRRMSYRRMAGVVGELPVAEEPAGASRGRRSRRGGRRRRGGGARSGPSHVAAPAPITSHAYATTNGDAAGGEPHTAPHDEIITVVRELMATLPAGRGVNIDLLSNALKSRGFSRPPGSPRLITRLRRIKELEVSRTGVITLLPDVAAPADSALDPSGFFDEPPTDAAPAGDAEASAAAGGEAGEAGAAARPRRRRRRGGRRRRGRGSGASVPATP
jgi:hypothetical protein